ncbi:MAG TPA: hypothetical protein VMG40_14515 [Bryobacteraceae bacterium]|nr:hypothetical protein [Bryobacteraceae bacterium]
MLSRIQRWQIAAAAAILCAAAAGALLWRNHAQRFDARGMIECLPQDQSTHVYVDIAALRRGGFLDMIAGSKTAEDPDYQGFVRDTGFDYRTDLDAVAAAFFHDDVYFTARGRFDWNKISAYASRQGGHCRNSVCEMPASTPGRNISLYPLRSDVLAMAVSKEPLAVTVIGPQQWRNPPQISTDPLWISAPAFVFSDVKNMPAGTHSFLSPLAQAQAVTFTAGPSPRAGDLELRLSVTCGSAPEAAALAKQFIDATDLLRKMLARDHMTPNAGDLSGVLVAGTFQQQDKQVLGRWPMERRFLEALVSGKIE